MKNKPRWSISTIDERREIEVDLMWTTNEIDGVLNKWYSNDIRC